MKPFWPIKIMWRWHERQYRKRYGRWTHSAANAAHPRSWVLHLWAVKVLFGG